MALTQEQKRRRHHNRHSRHRGDYPCWYCGKEKATCNWKQRFATKDDVLVEVFRFNAEHDYEVTAYVCQLYCGQWHFHTNRSKGAPPAPRTQAGRLFPNGTKVTLPGMDIVAGTVLMECAHCPGLIIQWDEGPVSHEKYQALLPALEQGKDDGSEVQGATGQA